MSGHKEPCGTCNEMAVDDDYSERCLDCHWLFHFPACYQAHFEAGKCRYVNTQDPAGGDDHKPANTRL